MEKDEPYINPYFNTPSSVYYSGRYIETGEKMEYLSECNAHNLLNDAHKS